MLASPSCAARQHNEMYAGSRSARNYNFFQRAKDCREDLNYGRAVSKKRDVVGRGFSRDIRPAN